MVRCPAEEGGRTRARLSGLVQPHARFLREGPDLLIPILPGAEGEAAALGYPVETRALEPLSVPVAPYEEVVGALDFLPSGLRRLLPRKWELFGDVLVLVLPGALEGVASTVAEGYARVLGARTVLAYEGVRGELRRPRTRKLWGDGTETVHTENGIRYRFDPARQMFASGNIDERMRAGSLASPSDLVVDLFAGIGYFTLPAAVRGGARVVACEKNPEAYRYLVGNAELNGVSSRVEARLGDCRDVAPEGVATRVFMGYVGATHRFLPTAMRALAGRGWVHYHETCPLPLLPDRPRRRMERAAARAGYRVLRSSLRRVKSYAPGVEHVVLDAEVAPA